jgi:cold-inducible RNA-binding protein
MFVLRAASRIEMKNRLYVGNLAFATTEDALKNAFGEFGDVSEVKLIIDRETGRSRGFAFVVMSTGEQAQKAVERLDGAMLDGRALRVNEAQERNGGGFAGSNGGADRGPRSSERRNRW